MFIYSDIPYALMLAPLRCGEKEEVSLRKLRIVAKYVDIMASCASWNQGAAWYTTRLRLQITPPQLITDIRGKSAEELADILIRRLNAKKIDFSSNLRLRKSGNNGEHIHRSLARITDYIETASVKRRSYYEEYLQYGAGHMKYEIEHILPTKPQEQDGDFEGRDEYRNYIGGLLLLPSSNNRSFRSKSYKEKRDLYLRENLLAQSLHEKAYQK